MRGRHRKPNPERRRRSLRKGLAVTVAAAAVPATMLLTTGAANAAPYTLPPDWGISCARATPFDNALVSWVGPANPNHYVDQNNNPYCRYIIHSGGSKELGIAAGYGIDDEPLSWDQACKLSYGPGAYATTIVPTVTRSCANPDYSYYVNVATPAAKDRR